jgi:hypothetical protein
MTNFLVKCADVSWQRHSIAIWIGNYRTKQQRLNGEWDPLLMVGERVRPHDLTAIAGEDYSRDSFPEDTENGPGSQGIWVWDDSPHDRLPIWRPPYTMDVKRAALLVTSAIDADSDEYYNFKLLNSADDTIIAYLYTNTVGLSGEVPNEMTVVSTANTVTRSQAVILQIEDENSKAPITGLTVVIDYEPSA